MNEQPMCCFPLLALSSILWPVERQSKARGREEIPLEVTGEQKLSAHRHVHIPATLPLPQEQPSTSLVPTCCDPQWWQDTCHHLVGLPHTLLRIFSFLALMLFLVNFSASVTFLSKILLVFYRESDFTD